MLQPFHFYSQFFKRILLLCASVALWGCVHIGSDHQGNNTPEGTIRALFNAIETNNFKNFLALIDLESDNVSVSEGQRERAAEHFYPKFRPLFQTFNNTLTQKKGVKKIRVEDIRTLGNDQIGVSASLLMGDGEVLESQVFTLVLKNGLYQFVPR